jgi:diaminopimelate dehydrogenase
MQKIRIAIVGFGNLGRACKQLALQRQDTFDLVAVYNKEASEQDGTQCIDDIEKIKGKIDVVLVCVGSQQDAPILVPKLAADFSTVDSFDTHSKMADYIKSIKPIGVSIVATGWDPGLMSVIRMYFGAFTPTGTTQSFWGPGVSMGHTNALRGINGVVDAIQFTVPVQKMMDLAAKGIQIQADKKHMRVCYVVAPKSEHARIKQTIITMPDYFANQHVKVNFVSSATFEKKFRNRNEHEGAVISHDGNATVLFGHTLKSNSQFTASIMLAYAVANFKLQRDGHKGVFTVADIAPKYLFQRDWIDLI